MEQAMVKAQENTFPALLEKMKPEIARALPSHMRPERMLRIVLTEFRRSEKLQRCDPFSIISAVVQCAQIGLEPGLLGQAYLVPYGRECTLVPGYQGLVDLARRTGNVSDIYANVVREQDEFQYETGLNLVLRHVPYNGDDDPGPMKKVYAVAKFKDGTSHAEVMSRRDVEVIRNRSAGYKNSSAGPWSTDFDEMARKTVIRRLCKQLPKSPELATALALDDAAMRGSQKFNITDVLAGTWAPEEPEVTVSPSATDKAAERVMEALKGRKVRSKSDTQTSTSSEPVSTASAGGPPPDLEPSWDPGADDSLLDPRG